MANRWGNSEYCNKASHRFFFFFWFPSAYKSYVYTVLVKNLPANAGNVRDVGWEDPPEEEMATHSSILALRIPWTEEPGGLSSIGSHRVRQD